MQYYRRKLLLSIIAKAGGSIDKMSFQKLLFLVCSSQQKATYDFIPYKYGCFSFTANADLSAMVKRGELSECETTWELASPKSYVNELLADDQFIINKATRFFGFSTDELLQYTYTNFPYYAKNSLVASRYLSVNETGAEYNITEALFTIGYEGISLEEYLNRLIKNDVAMLVDVRRNPLSMKYGFSKSLLSSRCDNVGILYKHIPEVGIASENRKNLTTKKEYDTLFLTYEKTMLPGVIDAQKTIVQLALNYKRIALTCFEADFKLCHRSILANSLVNYLPSHFHLEHL